MGASPLNSLNLIVLTILHTFLVGLRPYPVPRYLGTIPRDRGCRDGFPRDNLSKLITNNINNKYIINVHNYINTVSIV